MLFLEQPRITESHSEHEWSGEGGWFLFDRVSPSQFNTDNSRHRGK